MKELKRAHFRFFVSPENIAGDVFVCRERALVNQVKNVFRLKAGDAIEILDDSGLEYLVKIRELGIKEIKGEILGKRLAKNESAVKIHLYCSPIKVGNFEMVLEKATELGVFAFHPIICQNTIVKISDIKVRWERIIKEASEQSKRGVIPKIYQPQKVEDAVKAIRGGLSLVADEKAVHKLLKIAEGAKEINLFVGPEGGFSEQERDLFGKTGFEFISLSKTILRSETATIIGLGLIGNLL